MKTGGGEKKSIISTKKKQCQLRFGTFCRQTLSFENTNDRCTYFWDFRKLRKNNKLATVTGNTLFTDIKKIWDRQTPRVCDIRVA